MDNKTVTIYSTPTCHFCQLAKDFFAEKGVQYTGFDVSQDAAKREEMIKMTGQLGVPVIVIGGDIMVGFDRARIADKLGIAA
jgi:glutaredoxin 3